MSATVNQEALARVRAILKPVAEGICGEIGTEWIENLETLIDDAAGRWSLTEIEPVSNITYNFVAFATMPDGVKAVLKIGLPDRESPFEPLALQAFAGHGMVRVLALEANTNTMLLERADPGTSMEDLWTPEADEHFTREAAKFVTTLHHHPSRVASKFPRLEDWFKSFDRVHARYPNHSSPLPKDLVMTAEDTFRHLFETARDHRLVHGDLHHGNILHHHGGWIAIDPKGLIAELAYEPANLIRNPSALTRARNLQDLLVKRIKIYAEILAIEPKRIADYAFAHSVLSAIWSVEDFGTLSENELVVPLALASICT